MIKIRPSSVGKLMTDPRSKADKEAGNLSETAKTYCIQLAKEVIFGRLETASTKPMNKGTKVEDESIALYNSVFFTNYTKHVGRVETDVLSGECDICGEDIIVDIKSSWSLETFPIIEEQAQNDIYEWQVRAYMHLYDKPHGEVAFCLVDTPDELIGFEPASLHYVSHIPANQRITRCRYKRDMELEAKMLERCRKAQEYVQQIVERFKKEH